MVILYLGSSLKLLSDGKDAVIIASRARTDLI